MGLLFLLPQSPPTLHIVRLAMCFRCRRLYHRSHPQVFRSTLDWNLSCPFLRLHHDIRPRPVHSPSECRAELTQSGPDHAMCDCAEAL